MHHPNEERQLLLLKVLIALVAVHVFLMVGRGTTIRPGYPSISEMIQDNPVLKFIFLTYGIAIFTVQDHHTRYLAHKSRYFRLMNIFGTLLCISMGGIAVFDTDVYPTAHAGFFGFLFVCFILWQVFAIAGSWDEKWILPVYPDNLLRFAAGVQPEDEEEYQALAKEYERKTKYQDSIKNNKYLHKRLQWFHVLFLILNFIMICFYGAWVYWGPAYLQWKGPIAVLEHIPFASIAFFPILTF